MALKFKASAGILATAMMALTTVAVAPANAVLQQENNKHSVAQWLGLEPTTSSDPVGHTSEPNDYLRVLIDTGKIDDFDSVIVQDVETGEILSYALNDRN